MKSTPEHEPTVCPRCQRLFGCRVNSISQCQCQTVPLTDQQRQAIAALYVGCLCVDCLLALQTEYNALQQQ